MIATAPAATQQSERIAHTLHVERMGKTSTHVATAPKMPAGLSPEAVRMYHALKARQPATGPDTDPTGRVFVSYLSTKGPATGLESLTDFTGMSSVSTRARRLELEAAGLIVCRTSRMCVKIHVVDISAPEDVPMWTGTAANVWADTGWEGMPTSGVYRFYDVTGRVLYVGRTHRMKARMREHLFGNSVNSKTWYREVATFAVEEIEPGRLLGDMERQRIAELRPKYNAER